MNVFIASTTRFGNALQRARRGLWATASATASAIALSIVLAACGSGGGSDDAPAATGNAVGEPVAKTIGPAGGSMATTTQGLGVTLTIPAGALAADTVLTVTPVAAPAGETLRLLVQPAGLVFAKPVTVTVQYPPGQSPAGLATLGQSLGANTAYVATTVDAATRTLTAQLTTFGGATLQTLAQEQAQTQTHAPAQAQTLRTTAARARVLAVPSEDTGGLVSVYANFTTDELIDHVRRLISFARPDELEVVLNLQLSVSAALQRRTTDPAQAAAITTFQNDAKGIVCSKLDEVIATSRTAPIDRAGAFKPLVIPILSWDSLSQGLGGVPCSGPSALDAAHAVIVRELNWVKPTFAAAATPADITPPANDMRDTRAVQNAARTLQNTDAQGQALHLNPYIVALQDELLTPALVEARQAAWRQAKATGSLAHYIPLINGFGATSVLQQDIQYLRTALTVTTKSSAGSTLASAALGIQAPPEQPVDPVRSASLNLNARDATIEIGGSIAALNCPNSDSETLIVTFDGVEVQRVSSFGDTLLSGTLALPVLSAAGLLQAAHLAADDAGSHALRIARTGAACAATFGISDETLATVTLNFAPATLSATFVGTVTLYTDCNVFINGTYGASVSIARTSADSSTGLASGSGGRGGYAGLSSTPKPVLIVGDLGSSAEVTLPSGMVLSIHGNTASGSRTTSLDQCGDPPRPGFIYRETVSLTRQ